MTSFWICDSRLHSHPPLTPNFLKVESSCDTRMITLSLFVGASSSVCEAIAVHFAAARCRLVLSGRNGNLLRDTADKCVDAGATVEEVRT